MDLQNEAIEIQKIFHKDYKTYWEETEAIKAHLEARFKALGLYDVVNCVYVVTERDQYGEKLFKGVFANREKAVEYLAEDGLNESNIDEINEVELD